MVQAYSCPGKTASVAGLLSHREPLSARSSTSARNYHSWRCVWAANLADAQLFTSIPPGISRTSAAGDEIGATYQADCIASWVDAGFEPTTINAASERVDADSGIRRIMVERDASPITGKPLPYFGDLLSAIAGRTDGPFALVNADLLIPSHAGLAKRVMSLRPGEMIFGRRLDIVQPGASGTPYFNGYDFFAAHSGDVSALVGTGLVFGAPWWDHFFPLVMHLHGCHLTQLEPQVIHLRHDERWNMTTYRRLGDRFIAEMRSMVSNGEYAEHLLRILSNRKDVRRAAARDLTRFRWWRPLNPDQQRGLTLDRVGDLNLAVIDRLAPPPPSSSVRTPFRLRVQAKLLGLGATGDSFFATTYNSP